MSKKTPPEAALYVRLPATAVDKLDRAAEALGVHKKDLVAGLVSKYVDPDTRQGLSALGSLSQPRRVTFDLTGLPPTEQEIAAFVFMFVAHRYKVRNYTQDA